MAGQRPPLACRPSPPQGRRIRAQPLSPIVSVMAPAPYLPLCGPLWGGRTEGPGGGWRSPRPDPLRGSTLPTRGG
ncbi:hypothetical protein EH240_23505 [Mesorhizobium tamadayense]|uniref:Uncharacterized protein n=1 Tax=Mesorhizobium tamadayense TaxID=425306 RepID=A0A3P3FCP2_9HYPH|nr:hypothetical protein EH240_23505 [Mesorhizobium tamadayense]